jgi:hypothetical protein
MIVSLLAALLIQTAPASAAATCAAVAPPPSGLETWSMRATAKTIAIGSPAALSLSPAADYSFALKPDRAPAPDSFALDTTFSVMTAGTYRVALSAGAWIDMIHNGKVIASVAHTEGPACSGIRKIVDFPLTPGSYTLQLSGAKSATMTVLVMATK